MSVNSIANLASKLSSSGTDQAISIAVLKRALDAESATAGALINAIPTVQAPANLPPNLGRTINTTA